MANKTEDAGLDESTTRPTPPVKESQDDTDSEQAQSDYQGDRLKSLSRDASQLLDYAISVGADIPDRVIEGIRRGEAAVASGTMDQSLSLAFERHYRDLAALMRPVTVRSLNATAPSDATSRAGGLFGRSVAERWSRFLWIWTWLTITVIVVIEVVTELRTGFIPLDDFTDAELFDVADRGASAWIHGVEFVLPFLYGALGACAYLLRSCHKATYRRTFDALRRAEYLNRILLGVIAGGAIGLFGGDLLGVEAIEGFGEATLGFLAGYNCDFLFTSIERVIAAFLPKVEAQRAGAVASQEQTPAAMRNTA